jgi:hypothetical protein
VALRSPRRAGAAARLRPIFHPFLLRTTTTVEKRIFTLYLWRFRTIHFSCRLCENSDAKLSDPIFAQFWPVLSDQKPANRENPL